MLNEVSKEGELKKKLLIMTHKHKSYNFTAIFCIRSRINIMSIDFEVVATENEVLTLPSAGSIK